LGPRASLDGCVKSRPTEIRLPDSLYRLSYPVSVVCSEIHIKYVNVLCGQNQEFFSVKASGAWYKR
jgi:hypothetical protein